MSNIEVHVVRGTIVLATEPGRQFHPHSRHEAHDLVTRILSAIDNANGVAEVVQELAVQPETCGTCNRTKGPRHRCVGMKSK